MIELIEILGDTLIVVSIFGMPVFIVWIIYYFNNKKKAQFHASLQKLIESGQELSPELLQSIPGYREDAEQAEQKNDIRSGLMLSGVGIGMALLGQYGLDIAPLFGAGLLVLSIGIALLCYGIYSRDEKGDDTS